jgi:hypothetical protein
MLGIGRDLGVQESTCGAHIILQMVLDEVQVIP